MKHLGDAGTRQSLIARIRTVRPESPARFGAMTAPEMIVHCTDCFNAALGLRPVSDASTVFNRTVVKYVALYAPITWPPGFPTRPEIDPKRAGTRPAEFASDMAEMLRMLERFGAHQPPGTWRSHPNFGTMSESQWHRWGYLHTDHHLRQFGA